MTEHGARYTETAKILLKKGYLCIAEDHYGHGQTASSLDNLGVMPAHWEDLLKNIHFLSQNIKNKYPDLPIYLIGVSWGSFLVQAYIQQWGHEIQGAILMGTSGEQSNLNLIHLLSKISTFFKGRDNKAKFLNNRIFSKMNAYFEPTRTDYDWFSRDKEEVDKFIADPRAGFIVSNGFFLELSRLLKYIWSSENEQNIPQDLPLYILAGEEDSLSLGTRTVKSLISRYNKYGIKDIKHKYYPKARHDLLHEINQEEVITDIIQWIEAH